MNTLAFWERLLVAKKMNCCEYSPRPLVLATTQTLDPEMLRRVSFHCAVVHQILFLVCQGWDSNPGSLSLFFICLLSLDLCAIATP
jgi:hypothetical protein